MSKRIGRLLVVLAFGWAGALWCAHGLKDSVRFPVLHDRGRAGRRQNADRQLDLYAAMKNAGLMVLMATMLIACGRPDPEPAREAPPTAPPQADSIPTQAQIDRFLAEGPDPTLRKISVVDYWLHYKLMQATGMEKELGGEAQAIEALQALGNAYERKIRAAELELPKIIPVAFTGEGMQSGLLGMGLGSFVGLITGSMVSSMSDETLARLHKAGPIKESSAFGSFEMEFGKDGSLTQSLEFEVNDNSMNGKVRMKTKMDACPDADGRVTVESEVDSQMSVKGKPGTGGRVQTTFKYERYLDDDAHLSLAPEGMARSLHIRMGGYENFEIQSVDLTVGQKRDGSIIFEHHDEQGYSIFRPEEVKQSAGMMRGVEFLQTLVAEMTLRGMGSSASPWESGRCIDLKVTTSPAERKGVRPGTSFNLEAMPRTKPDGLPAGGTVTATLTGGSSLQPASGKVPADAKYVYVAPDKKEESASIAFESRSKRGVGKITLEFDTKVARAYHMEGGADELHVAGVVCDLTEPFYIEGSGVTVRFEPGSDSGGSYSYSGSMSGFRVHGHGTYVVKTDGEVAVGIVATGPGSVETPMGTQTAGGTEIYTLTPYDGAECQAAAQ